MGIYNPCTPPPPLLSTQKLLQNLNLQEKSSDGASGKNAANLEAGCSAGELAGRRRVRSSAGRLSTSAHDGAGGVASASGRGRHSATLDGVAGVTSTGGDGGHGDDGGGVRSRASDAVGCRRRGGVLCNRAVGVVRHLNGNRKLRGTYEVTVTVTLVEHEVSATTGAEALYCAEATAASARMVAVNCILADLVIRLRVEVKSLVLRR
jgi:hypothetical protein